MDTISTHILGIRDLLREGHALATIEVARGASIQDLTLEAEAREWMRDVLADMTLPIGRYENSRSAVVQGLDFKSAQIRDRIRVRRRRALRDKMQCP